MQLDDDGGICRDTWSVMSAPGTRLLLTRLGRVCSATVRHGLVSQSGERSLVVVSTLFGELTLPFASGPVHWCLLYYPAPPSPGQVAAPIHMFHQVRPRDRWPAAAGAHQHGRPAIAIAALAATVNSSTAPLSPRPGPAAPGRRMQLVPQSVRLDGSLCAALQLQPDCALPNRQLAAAAGGLGCATRPLLGLPAAGPRGQEQGHVDISGKGGGEDGDKDRTSGASDGGLTGTGTDGLTGSASDGGAPLAGGGRGRACQRQEDGGIDWAQDRRAAAGADGAGGALWKLLGERSGAEQPAWVLPSNSEAVAAGRVAAEAAEAAAAPARKARRHHPLPRCFVLFNSVSALA